jgi:hypothetical protein
MRGGFSKLIESGVRSTPAWLGVGAGKLLSGNIMGRACPAD